MNYLHFLVEDKYLAIYFSFATFFHVLFSILKYERELYDQEVF